MKLLAKTAIFESDCEAIAAADLPWQRFAGARILITGAAGMIPSYTVGAILAARRLHGFDCQLDLLVRQQERAAARFGELLDEPGVRVLVGDITDHVFDTDYDFVFHGASPARPKQHAGNPAATLRANALGTISLLDQTAPAKPVFVLLSSAEVYGAQASAHAIEEDDFGPLNCYDPRGCYFEGKRLAETAVAVYATQHGITPRVLRFSHIYGPGLALDDGRVQADFAAQAHQGKDIVLLSDGRGVRSYTYVADAVCGMFYAVLLGSEAVYNVADRRGHISILQLAMHFAAASKAPVRVRVPRHQSQQAGVSTQQAGVSKQRYLGLDAGKLLQLGWRPVIPLAEGTRRTVTALVEQEL